MKNYFFLLLALLFSKNVEASPISECNYTECRIPFRIHSGLIFGTEAESKTLAHKEHDTRCQNFKGSLQTTLGSLLTYISCGQEEQTIRTTHLKKTYYFQDDNSERNLQLDVPTVFSDSKGIALIKQPAPKYIRRLDQNLHTKWEIFSAELFPSGVVLEFLLWKPGKTYFPEKPKDALEELNAQYEVRCAEFVEEAKKSLGSSLLLVRCEDPEKGRQLLVGFKEVLGSKQAFLRFQSNASIFYRD